MIKKFYNLITQKMYPCAWHAEVRHLDTAIAFHWSSENTREYAMEEYKHVNVEQNFVQKKNEQYFKPPHWSIA